MLRRRARGHDDARWKKLIEIAKRADDDAWRRRFRDTLLQSDRTALEELADTGPVVEFPSATVYLLADLLLGLGSVEKAKMVLRGGQRRHPDDYWLNAALGHVCRDLLKPPHYEDALHYYSICVALRPWSARTRVAVGWLLEQTGAAEEAMAEYSTAFELEPNNARLWNDRGWLYRTVRQYEKARLDFSKAIELDPHNTWAFEMRGLAYRELKQYDKAIADLSKAIVLDAKGVQHWTERGWVYLNMQEYDKAIGDFSEAIELDPNYERAWSNRARAYRELKQYDKAHAEYREAIRLIPQSAELKNELAFFLSTCADARLRDACGAVELARRALELKPREGTYWNTLGAAEYRAGDCKKAVAALERSMELRSGGDGFDWFVLAMAKCRLGDMDEARKWFDQAVEWMDKNAPQDKELLRFRVEAEELMNGND